MTRRTPHRLMIRRRRDTQTVSSAKNRAKFLGLDATLTTEEWRACQLHFRGRCAYCGVGLPYRWSRTCRSRIVIDHVVPMVLGGPTVRQNCVPACRRCNSLKMARAPWDHGFWALFPEGAHDRVTSWTGPLRPPADSRTGSLAMRRYRVLEDKLRRVRSANAPGTALEDPILQEMTDLWFALSEQERETLDGEGATCWPDIGLIPRGRP